MADVCGSGGKRQKRNAQKNKMIVIKMAKHGGTKINEKGGGIITSGVEGLMGKFHIGDAKLGSTFDIYNLIRNNRDGAGGYSSEAKSGNGKLAGDCKLIGNDAKVGIDLDEPPDTNPITNIKQNFNFGGYNISEEMVKEKNVEGMEDPLEENDDEEVVCETL